MRTEGPRSDPPSTGPRARCGRCLWPVRLCLCPDIPLVESRTRVVIVRHVTEARRMSNSGRIAALALENSETIEHGRLGAPAAPEALSAPGTWLLFPEGPPLSRAPAPPAARLVVLDGTWAQARRMRQRLPGLRGLPVLRLPDAAAPAARLREAPCRDHLSTLEAIAGALRILGEEAPAAALERLFLALVDRSRRTGRIMPPSP